MIDQASQQAAEEIVQKANRKGYDDSKIDKMYDQKAAQLIAFRNYL